MELHSASAVPDRRFYARYAQIALTVGVAEEACQFEHRDLHWGNLLIKRGAPAAAAFRFRCSLPPRLATPSTKLSQSLTDSAGNLSFAERRCRRLQLSTSIAGYL